MIVPLSMFMESPRGELSEMPDLINEIRASPKAKDRQNVFFLHRPADRTFFFPEKWIRSGGVL